MIIGAKQRERTGKTKRKYKSCVNKEGHAAFGGRSWRRQPMSPLAYDAPL